MKKLLLALNLFSIIGLQSADRPNDVVQQAEQECGICLDSKPTKDLYSLPKINHSNGSMSCGHTIHKKCLREWTKQSMTCPLCRRDLTHDDIPSVSIQDLINAKEIKATDDFTGVHINLSSHSISSLEGLSNIPKIRQAETLDLSYNQLKHISAQDFIGLPELGLLFLNNNKIETFDPQDFAELPKLKTICLNDNNFSLLQKMHFLYFSITGKYRLIF